jgi:MarR-like DNA-binding transcriptional regulator SgrR of sgrS sRNA
MTSQLYQDIQQTIQQRGEVDGYAKLAELVGCRNQRYVRKLAQQLEADGEITIQRTRGGRGNRSRLINRNSAGYPRKVQR